MDRFGWLFHDLRHALRSLAKDRGVALVAVFTLALGIGSSTVIFSVVDNVLLEPFPYADPSRVLELQIVDSARADDFGRPVYTIPEFLAIRDENHVFSEVMGVANVDVRSAEREGARHYRGARLTPNSFDFLKGKALLGRTFIPADAEPGAAPVFLMSHRLWTSEYGSDPELLGSTVKLNGEARTLIGVMPPRFLFWAADIWLPLDLKTRDPADARPFLWPLGRLRPGVDLRTASADIELLARRLAQARPEDFPKRFTVRTQTLLDGVVGRFRSLLYTLLGAVGLLLLIACGNVANLLLARATARQREIAVRATLGASRVRLLGQLLVEGLVLAAVSGVVGCLFAYAALKGVVAAVPTDTIPAESVIALNPVVLVFALGVMLLTTLLCGLAPALHGVGGQLVQRLKDGSKGAGGEVSHGRLRSVLVVAEVALSIVLLVGAGLMMRSFVKLQRVELGMNIASVVAAAVPLPEPGFDTPEKKNSFYRQVLERIGALPGVTAVSLATGLPPFGGMRSTVAIPGAASGEPLTAQCNLVSDGYFRTLGLRSARGRLITHDDVAGERRVAVVNEALARSFFGAREAIGASLKFDELDRLPGAPRDAYFEIVGVVADARNAGLRDAIVPEAFLPYSVAGFGQLGLLVKSTVDSGATLASIRREVWALDPGVALTFTGTLEGFVERFGLAEPRFGFILLGAFAGLGLLLVAIGVFSVMAYAVSLQTREIGIRMALGADERGVLRMVLGKGMRLIGAGVLLGVAASAGLGRFLAGHIWGVTATDPPTFVGVVAMLLVVGTSACLLPARRASRVDPLVALRYE